MRAPAAARPSGTVRRTFASLLATLTMLAIIVAGPVLLLSLAGNPLPGHLPSIDEAAQRLRQPDDGTLLLWALAVAGWLAWAVVAGSLLLELAAQVTGRCAPAVLGAPQRLANLLVAAALASMSVPGVSHASAAYVEADPAHVAATGVDPGQRPAALHSGGFDRPSMVHEVDRGDWMWHIAGRYLGDESRYPEIAALNPHLAEQYADFPDHIRPGDRVLLPTDAHDHGERRHATGDLLGGPEPPAEPPAEPSAEPTPPEPTREPGPAPSAEPDATQATVPHGMPGNGPPAEPEAAPPAEPEPESASPGLAPLLTGGVVASVLLGAIAWHRARNSAYRRHRRSVVSSARAETEATMRATASVDVARLDHALRALAAAGDVGDRTFPDIGAVWVAGGDIHLVLAAPCHQPPPPPFRAADTGTWELPAGADLPVVTGALAPMPTLVTVASQPGRHLLVDLERLGMLTITGDPRGCADLLRHIAAELAHNPWSDQAEVTLVGFPPGQADLLASLNPQRVQVAASLPAATERVRRRLTDTTGALRSHGLADSVDGRIRDTAADTWTPQLLLLHQPAAEHDQLLRDLGDELAAAGRRCAVAVAVTTHAGGPGGRGQVTVTGEGLLTAGFLAGAADLPAAALPEHLLASYADLVRSAATPGDHAVPPAGEPWAAGTDATGARLAVPEAAAALTADTPAMPLPTITGAGWPDHDGPGIAILGPVQIAASGPPPARRLRTCQELVVFLAARGDAGATAGEITQHLWPQQQPPAPVRTEVITCTRRWLGEAPDGRPWLPDADAHGRYRLRDGLPVDWYLFRRLRTRGQRSGGAEDLRAALRLVRGAPLQEVAGLAAVATRTSYSWLPGSPFAPDLVRAGVIDTAHELVEQCLAAGDLPTARWAVEQAWLADPGRHDDHPWRDLMRIVHADGDRGRLHDVLADMLRWRDADHPDELAAATRDLVATLLRPQPAGAG